MSEPIDFAAYVDRKRKEKEREEMKRFYAGIEKLIAHLLPQKTKEGRGGDQEGV